MQQMTKNLRNDWNPLMCFFSANSKCKHAGITFNVHVKSAWHDALLISVKVKLVVKQTRIDADASLLPSKAIKTHQ